MGNIVDDVSRSMREAAVRDRRRAMLYMAHVAPLTAYAAALRERGSARIPALEVPDFDPCDGGTEAQILFLFEKPGPMTSVGSGSGFISRNNDDPSAEATLNFMQRAAIPRELTATWNVIPWWNGTRKVTGQELREGASCVEQLIGLFPKLRVVILVGKRAARARKYLVGTGFEVLTSAHPSPLVRARYPKRWSAIPEQWRKAVQFIELEAGATSRSSGSSGLIA